MNAERKVKTVMWLSIQRGATSSEDLQMWTSKNISTSNGELLLEHIFKPNFN